MQPLEDYFYEASYWTDDKNPLCSTHYIFEEEKCHGEAYTVLQGVKLLRTLNPEENVFMEVELDTEKELITCSQGIIVKHYIVPYKSKMCREVLNHFNERFKQIRNF